MTKQKSPKRAWLMSVISMLMCCAMLIGTTFAWFTDTVTSGKNKIVAGNLDVEMYHGDGTGDEDKVTETTALFLNPDGSEIIWEPGVIAYEKFTVKNVGTLALKYDLSLNVADRNFVTDKDGNDTGKSLADVIKVAVVPESEIDREITREYVQSLELSESFKDVDYDGILLPGEETKEKDGKIIDNADKFAVILYWEPNVKTDDDYNINNGKGVTKVGGDDASAKSLFINFGVNLVATQVPYEEDSFNDQYDEGAKYPVLPVTSTTEVKPTSKTVFTLNKAPVEGEETIVSFPEDALEEGLAKLTFSVTQPGNTEEEEGYSAIADLNLTLMINGEEIHEFNGKSAEITTYIDTGLKGVEVRSKENPEETVESSYDNESGKLTFKASHFSTYTVYTMTGFDKMDEEKIAEGNTIRIGQDPATAQYVKFGKNKEYDMLFKYLTYDNPGEHYVTFLTDIEATQFDNAKAYAGPALTQAPNFTVDLNGHTFTESGSTLSAKDLGTGAYGSVAFLNGTYQAASNRNSGIMSLWQIQDMNFDHVDFVCTETNKPEFWVKSTSTATFNMSSCTVQNAYLTLNTIKSAVIKDTTITKECSNIISNYALQTNGVTNTQISGSTLNGNVVFGSGTVSISDTKINGTLFALKGYKPHITLTDVDFRGGFNKDFKGEITIKSGTFDFNPTQYNNGDTCYIHVATGSKKEQVGDLWVVSPK